MKFLIPSYKHLGKFWKNTQKAQNNKNQAKESIPFLINYNLMFQANKFQLLMIPKHPKIVSRNEKAIVIDTQSIVLELLFLRKCQNKVFLMLSSNSRIKIASSHKVFILNLIIFQAFQTFKLEMYKISTPLSFLQLFKIIRKIPLKSQIIQKKVESISLNIVKYLMKTLQ